MDISVLSSFKTQAILDVYNHLAVAKDEKPLASWDKSKASLVERIVKNYDKSAIERAIDATEDGAKPGTKGEVVKTAKAKSKTAKAKSEKPAKRAAKTSGDKKPRGTGIGATIREMIKANPEASALDILTSFQKKHPEAKTTVGCIGWYRSQMYKSGELVK